MHCTHQALRCLQGLGYLSKYETPHFKDHLSWQPVKSREIHNTVSCTYLHQRPHTCGNLDIVTHACGELYANTKSTHYDHATVNLLEGTSALACTVYTLTFPLGKQVTLLGCNLTTQSAYVHSARMGMIRR